MKYLILIFLSIITLYAEVLKPVAFVSPSKFSGLWYEIARTYNSYQDTCVASSVEYRLIEPLKYKVFNRCFENVVGGELIEYSGTAQPKEGESMSSIDMTYFWFFTKNYNVYYIDKDYTYAVVADEFFEQVWIMSREPTMPEEKLKAIKKHLASSMNLDLLIYTPQDEKGRYQ